MEKQVFSELLEKTKIILSSETVYANALRGTIESFLAGMTQKKEIKRLDESVAALKCEIAALTGDSPSRPRPALFLVKK